MAAATGEPKAEDIFDRQYAVVATAIRAGNIKPLARLRDDLLAYLQKHPDDYGPRVTLECLLDSLVETNDRDGISRVGRFYHQHPTAGVEVYESAMALACADVGMTDEAHDHAARVSAAVAERFANPKTDDAEKFAAAMWLARVQARFGGVATVNKTLASIPNPPDRTSNPAAQPYLQLESAYAAGGCYDEAIRLAKIGDPEIYLWVAQRTACEMAFAGHAEDARKLAATLQPIHRISVYYYTAMRQVKRGDTAGLAEWIDKVPTAAERCLLDVAVANALSDRRNRDLEDHIRDIGPHRPG